MVPSSNNGERPKIRWQQPVNPDEISSFVSAHLPWVAQHRKSKGSDSQSECQDLLKVKEPPKDENTQIEQSL